MEQLYALSRSILLIDPAQSVPRQVVNQVAQTFEAASVVLYDHTSGEVFRRRPGRFSRHGGTTALGGVAGHADSTSRRATLHYRGASGRAAGRQRSVSAASIFPIPPCRV